jgi:putative transposase
MIDVTHSLSIVRQAQLLELSRSAVYYEPLPTSDADLTLMRRIDELHLEHPFAGSRMLRDLLNREGFGVGRKHVATLMRKMGIEALYQRPRTSGRDREHPVFPYLLRGMTIDRPNQVWAMDTTYSPMRRGFVYLTAVVDWATRRVLAWRVSISLAADAAVEALKEAIARYGVPEIMNTDQGSQFTASDFIDERLWKTIKYEHVYLHAYETVSEARTRLATYLDFYNRRRPHSALDRRTPDDVYFALLPQQLAA